jgi:nucleoside 2-deoxyribosyltransferase
VRPLSIYFAGSLFTNKDLIGNMYLVDSIHRLSGYRYRCILPQNLQQMTTDPKEIKNNDLIQVRDCDGILVSFDGTELDSGTVVEFMAAKFLNKPPVVYRTDFRNGGDTLGGDPWNLMLYNYPRTQHVRETSHIMDIYQEHLQKYQHMKGNYSHIVSQEVSNTIAKSLIEKLDKVFTGYNRDENDDCAKFANGINMKDMFDQFCGLDKNYSN